MADDTPQLPTRAFPKLKKTFVPGVVPPPPPMPAVRLFDGTPLGSSPIPSPPPLPAGVGPPPPPPVPVSQPKKSSVPRKKGGKSVSIAESAERVSSRRYVSVKDRSDTGFVGLANQGATCYLNSLLQTLYMTPEFRLKIYQWTYHEVEDGRSDYCIPLQLQNLFARLQFSKCEAVGTAALTHSFRWDDAEAFQQHDVQELCRVLFEALDKSFLQGMMRGECMIPTVSEMVEGVSANYLRCLTCGYTRERIESFQDLQLQVRGVGDIRESLGAYTQPEVLDGENQWLCETCDTKVDAHKGQKLNRLPYLLTLHQMRFDIDYATMSRIKLDVFVTFPGILDMAPYFDSERVDSGTSMCYELYSIMIHSGGAMGGHYYAFIKSFANGEWYNFNDTSVTKCSIEQLASIGLVEAVEELKAREPVEPIVAHDGTVSRSHRTDVTGSTSAYMLLYRRIENSNIRSVADELCPTSARALVDTENEKFEENKAANKHKMETLKLRFYYEEDGASESPLVSIHNSETLEKALELALKELTSLSDDFPLDRIRLRNYNPFTKKMGAAFPIKTGRTLKELELPALKQFMIETREDGSVFTALTSGEISLNVAQLTVSAASGEAATNTWLTSAGEEFFTAPFSFSINAGTTIGMLKAALSPRTNIPVERLRLVTLDVSSAVAKVVVLPDDALLVDDLGLVDQDFVYVEDVSDPAARSLVVERFEYEQNLIEISFNSPAEEGAPAPSSAPSYDLQITFDQRKPISALKEAMGSIIGLKANEFKLCRNLLSKEYKDENASLSEADILDGMAVFVQKGRPLRLDEYCLRVFLYDPWSVVLPTKQGVVGGDEEEVPRVDGKVLEPELAWFSGAPIFEVVVAENEKVESVKAKCLEKLLLYASEACRSAVYDGKVLRLREKAKARVGLILWGEHTVKELLPFIRDRQEMAIQLVDQEDKVSENDVIVRIHRWCPDTWALGDEHAEFALKKDDTVGSTVERLATRFNLVGTCAVGKPLRSATISTLPETVPDVNWNVHPDRPNGGSPWMLRDGDVLLFKDTRLRDNIPEWIVRNRPKEKALRIYTRYDDDFEGDVSEGGT